MDFNKNDFLDFWRRKILRGTSIDLEIWDCFGYFEATPYKDITIRYNISEVRVSREGEVSFFCSTRVRQFPTGTTTVTESEFNRYAKEIRLHGELPDFLLD